MLVSHWYNAVEYIYCSIGACFKHHAHPLQYNNKPEKFNFEILTWLLDMVGYSGDPPPCK